MFRYNRPANYRYSVPLSHLLYSDGGPALEVRRVLLSIHQDSDGIRGGIRVTARWPATDERARPARSLRYPVPESGQIECVSTQVLTGEERDALARCSRVRVHPSGGITIDASDTGPDLTVGGQGSGGNGFVSWHLAYGRPADPVQDVHTGLWLLDEIVSSYIARARADVEAAESRLRSAGIEPSRMTAGGTLIDDGTPPHIFQLLPYGFPYRAARLPEAE